MKIIPVGKYFINLDMVVAIHPNKELHLLNKEVIQLSDDELHEFVKMYNLVDTDEVKDLATKAVKVLFTNPQYLTEEGLKAQVKRLVEQYDLKEFVKTYNKGKMMKELTNLEMVDLYKAIVEQIKGSLPF